MERFKISQCLLDLHFMVGDDHILANEPAYLQIAKEGLDKIAAVNNKPVLFLKGQSTTGIINPPLNVFYSIKKILIGDYEYLNDRINGVAIGSGEETDFIDPDGFYDNELRFYSQGDRYGLERLYTGIITFYGYIYFRDEDNEILITEKEKIALIYYLEKVYLERSKYRILREGRMLRTNLMIDIRRASTEFYKALKIARLEGMTDSDRAIFHEFLNNPIATSDNGS